MAQTGIEHPSDAMAQWVLNNGQESTILKKSWEKDEVILNKLLVDTHSLANVSDAGAHGKLSFHDRIIRQMRHKHPREYMEHALAGNPIQSEQAVARADLPFEFMMNALRLIDGIELPLFAERTGLSLQALRKPLQEAESRGLLERDHLRLRPTLKGQRFLNDLLQIFLR